MMKHRYLPATEADRSEMLKAIGQESIDGLFADIPESIRFEGRLNIPEAMDEPTLLRHLRRMASKNKSNDEYASFLGAGMYDHHIPVVINHVLSRSEFYTAYTPYQPEISQGELQAIFEFQSYICELTGMDVANASMYDGFTALAEAAALASGATKRSTIVLSAAVHPEARKIVHTSAKGLGLRVVEVSAAGGVTDTDQLAAHVDEDTAAVLVQSPNFFGCIEDLAAVEQVAHRTGSLFVVSANPISLALLEAPGKLGADLVVGDAQPLGIPASFGGPSCGFFAATKKWMRRMPGRIVGQTVDRKDRRGFVLTLQAREQHIRREKATSNICSNQALLALAASVYLSTMGKQGIRDVAKLNVQKAHYAAERLTKSGRWSLSYSSPFFNEFVLQWNGDDSLDSEALQQHLLKQGIIGGYDLGKADPAWNGQMLAAVTEQRTREEIDRFAEALEAWT